jgi:hypothetical protein
VREALQALGQVLDLVPALAGRYPSLEVTLFHARFEPQRTAEPWMDAFAREELDGSIRTLYPRWNLAARPALPPSLRSADLVLVMTQSHRAALATELAKISTTKP